MAYDSRIDTFKHIATVRGFFKRAVSNLLDRGEAHDLSKLESPEFWAREFGEINPGLLRNGAAIRDMSLLDILQILCDWKAATMRHNDGDICGRSRSTRSGSATRTS